MRRLLMSAGVAALMASASSAEAAFMSFTANPTTNSTEFNTFVTGLGGTINSNVNFNSHPVGALQNNFYAASEGVTFSTTGDVNTVQNGAGPGQANTNPPLSPGEGLHASSNYLFDALGSSSTLTISFDRAVYGAGLFLVDLFNSNSITIRAFDSINGSGTELGSATSVALNFQQNRLYFMGLGSTDGNIRSIVLNLPGSFNDTIGIDDLRFAEVPDAPSGATAPEPGSIALMGMGAFGLAGRLIRRRKTAE